MHLLIFILCYWVGSNMALLATLLSIAAFKPEREVRYRPGLIDLGSDYSKCSFKGYRYDNS